MKLGTTLAPLLGAIVTCSNASFFSHDVRFQRPSNAAYLSNIHKFSDLMIPGATKCPPASSFTTVPEVDDQSFWFANFTIGASKSLECLIDTGSSDTLLNPGVYKPSRKYGVDQNRTFSITFATTNSDGSGTETLSGEVYKDIVGTMGLNVTDQAVGKTLTPKSPPSFPHDGLVGFAGRDSSALNSPPWFHSLCNEGKVEECRFGLAYKTDGTGKQIMGGVDPTLFKGQELTVAPIVDEWVLSSDIAVDNKIVQKNALLITDSGTTVIYGPIPAVKQIFQMTNISYVEYPGNSTAGTPSYLYGYFPCNKPPTVGFSFPAIANLSVPGVSKGSKIFNIVPKAWSVKNNGNNNCTATLQGTDEFSSIAPNLWLVGQSFHQGHYIDHNIAGNTMGFATLK